MTGINACEDLVAGMKLDAPQRGSCGDANGDRSGSGDAASPASAAAAAAAAAAPPPQTAGNISGADDDNAGDDDAANAGDANAGDAGGCAALPAVDDGALMSFLKDALAELEAAQGGAPDDEARALLDQLVAANRGISSGIGGGGIGSGGGAGVGGRGRGGGGGLTGLAGELEIAAAIDGLSAQLSAVEAQFAALDDGARRLVAAGASAWVGGSGGGGRGGREAGSSGSGIKAGTKIQAVEAAPLDESGPNATSKTDRRCTAAAGATPKQ